MTTATLHSATPLSDSALFLSFSARLSERQRAALSALAAGRPILAAGRKQRGMAWPIVDGWVIPDDQHKLLKPRVSTTPRFWSATTRTKA